MRLTSFYLVLAGLLPAPGFAEQIFVDPKLGGFCDTYNSESRDCSSDASIRGYANLNAVLSVLKPGDELLLREGQYAQISIPVSGSVDKDIVISGYHNESVVISDTRNVGIHVAGQSDLIIRNLEVTDVLGFGRLEDSNRISLENIQFSKAIASGTTGALKLVRSQSNRIVDSSFQHGSDLLLLQDDSNFNVLERNRFHTAHHSLLSVRCSNYNIIRNNRFENPEQKALEIFDCEGVSDAPVRLDSTARNLIENNLFLDTAPSSRNYKFNAIQHGGQGTIVRRNLFSGNRGGGVAYQYYSDESLYVHGNRLYNNTFYANKCGAIIGQSGARPRMYDNIVLNNLLINNTACDGRGDQYSVASRHAVKLLKNQIDKLAPGFVDPVNGDFCLREDSSAVDAGAYMAQARSEGSGTEIPVSDSGWFFDGYGVVPGDQIRLEDSRDVYRVIRVDDERRFILLDRETVWRKGQGIHLTFTGIRPDNGAYERGLAPCESE